jgi:sugar phosphate isomerase/epimerase
MKTIRGPGVMLSQFMGDTPPFDSFDGVVPWLAKFGYVGAQLPVHDSRLIDLERAANDDAYCRSLTERFARHGMVITELAAHRAGQLLAVNPAANEMVDVFAPPEMRGNPAKRSAWAEQTLRRAIDAAVRLGLTRLCTFSGAFAWPYFYPWPPPPPGLIDAAFAELARRWRPLLDHADRAGVDICFELHPGEDLHDGATFDRFLALVDGHRRTKILYDPSHMLMQHMDYLGFIDRYHARIGAFHVKDAEFVRSAASGVYGGYQDWVERPARFRNPGDGQVDFSGIFSRLSAHDYDGWAVLEWECCLKRKEDGAAEGAKFIAGHIIRVTEKPFDAALRRKVDPAALNRMLGISA